MPLGWAWQRVDCVDKYVFKLYVMGQSTRSATAAQNIREVCEAALPGHYELHVIDVLEDPQLAESQKILATPTLVKESPPPLRRVIGDLSDRTGIMAGLDLRPVPGEWLARDAAGDSA